MTPRPASTRRFLPGTLLLPGALAIQAVVAQSQGTANRLPPQVRVNPEIVHLPVKEGSDIRFVRLSRAQGLSQQRVTHIVQDDQGFMWFGTQYGLNRFDGYQFRVFKREPDDPASLCGVFISALFKDRAGATPRWTATTRSPNPSSIIRSTRSR
jgi:hypothetical protein